MPSALTFVHLVSPMSVVLTSDPPKKLLAIIAFFVVLFLIVEISGLRAQLSPETIRALFVQHTLIGLALFLRGIQRWELTICARLGVFSGGSICTGKRMGWCRDVHRWVVLLDVELLCHSLFWRYGAS